MSETSSSPIILAWRFKDMRHVSMNGRWWFSKISFGTKSRFAGAAAGYRSGSFRSIWVSKNILGFIGSWYDVPIYRHLYKTGYPVGEQPPTYWKLFISVGGARASHKDCFTDSLALEQHLDGGSIAAVDVSKTLYPLA